MEGCGIRIIIRPEDSIYLPLVILMRTNGFNGIFWQFATMKDNGEVSLSNPRVQELNYFQNILETEVNDARMNYTAADPDSEDIPPKPPIFSGKTA